MRRSTRLLVATPALAAGLALVPALAAQAATASGATASATGANEVAKGDPTATAHAVFTFDTTAHQLCYTVTATALQAVAMHLHKGAAGTNGPVVVPLDPTKIGAGKTCTAVAPALLADIAGNPAGYYFNAHTKAFPAGAVRGQLVPAAAATTGTSAASGSPAAPTAVAAGNGGQAADSGAALPVTLLVLGGAAVSAAGWRLARR